tara:strand:- start:81698 stop:82366 length:669 start_codon:yes stop_codon:yes gene_type:complete
MHYKNNTQSLAWPCVRAKPFFVAALAFLLLTFGTSASQAHLMPAGKGTLNVVGSKAYIVVSLPVSSFFEGNSAKTSISQVELSRDETALRDTVRAGIQVTSAGEAARFDQILLSLPSGEGHDGTGDEDLLVMIVARFSAPPTAVKLASSLWTKGKGGLAIKATISEGEKTLATEMGELSSHKKSVVFFAPPSESTSAKLLALPIILLFVGTLFVAYRRRRKR